MQLGPHKQCEWPCQVSNPSAGMIFDPPPSGRIFRPICNHGDSEGNDIRGFPVWLRPGVSEGMSCSGHKWTESPCTLMKGERYHFSTVTSEKKLRRRRSLLFPRSHRHFVCAIFPYELHQITCTVNVLRSTRSRRGGIHSSNKVLDVAILKKYSCVKANFRFNKEIFL